jgi:Methyltransferase domain
MSAFKQRVKVFADKFLRKSGHFVEVGRDYESRVRRSEMPEAFAESDVKKIGAVSDHDMMLKMKQIAVSGIGSDECLKYGFLPVALHFYSPIPDIEDLKKRDVWGVESKLWGIDFDVERQLEFLRNLSEYGEECRWPIQKSSEDIFYHSNNSFSFSCAAVLHSVIRKYRPSRLVEIGSGMSSIIISNAVLKNEEEFGKKCEYTVIDPYVSELVASGMLKGVSDHIANRVELVGMEPFQRLGKHDILFIDSSHQAKIGSDVNFEYLELIPQLARGVLIHIHDVCLPWEYPREYALNETFRQFWTEQYVLQAFLAFNDEFEILLAGNYMHVKYYNEYTNAFPHYDRQKRDSCSSFWMQRRIRV